MIHVETLVQDSPRVADVRRIFDLPAQDKIVRDWDCDFSMLDDQEFNVGLIVGPSGSGKTRVARASWPDAFAENYQWSADKAVVDDFPAELTSDDVTKLLSSVGFSSPPSWLQPYHTLSNGEQFRANMARALCDDRQVIVIDEFTSVVDRTVAQIGSAAFAREVRKRGKRVILLSCHYDIIEWLQPDWIARMDSDTFEWRSLQRRPDVLVTVRNGSFDLWKIFGRHHYLTNKLPKNSKIFYGTINERPAVFLSTMKFPLNDGFVIIHLSRVVTLPDFQGIGLGVKMCEFIASLYAARTWRVSIVTTHPAMKGYFGRSPDWRQIGRTRKLGYQSPTAAGTVGAGSKNRFTASFEYVGENGDWDVAKGLGIEIV